MTTLDRAVKLAGAGTVLVGHSLACALIAHWAAGDPSRRVHGALLVAPADPEAWSFPRGPTGFAPMPMQRLRFRSVVVASSNDPYVSLERARAFATAWGSAFVDIGQAGHINSASGLDEWQEGLAFLRDLRLPQAGGRLDGATT